MPAVDHRNLIHIASTTSICIIIFGRIRDRRTAENHPCGVRSWLRYHFAHEGNGNDQSKFLLYEKVDKHDKRENGGPEHSGYASH